MGALTNIYFKNHQTFYCRLYHTYLATTLQQKTLSFTMEYVISGVPLQVSNCKNYES